MSLVVYVGTDKFKAESGAAVREQNATEITLSDIAKGQYNTDKASTVENQLLVIDTFSEDALASLKSWLKKETESACVIAWPQPVAWLAASLATGTTGEEALSDWLSQAKRLLALFRSARRQVTLAGYMPGCELEVIKAPVIDRSENPIYQLAAAYLSSQSQALQDTYAYLAASSKECPVGEGCEAEVAQTALSEYHARQAESEQGQRNVHALQEADAAQERQQQDIARLKGELSSARDEHALMLQQLQSAQQVVSERANELHAQREQAKQGTQRLQELESQLQAMKVENASLKQAFDTQRKEQNVIQQHNQALKKENEALKQAFDIQRKEQDVTRQHNQALKKENEALKQAFDTTLKEQGVAQQHNQALKKENEVLKQAFDTQRKEKEVTHQHNQALKKENEALKQACDTKRNEQGITQQQNQALKQENESLKQACDIQRNEQGVTQQQNQVLKQENESLKQACDVLDKEKEINHKALASAQQENVQLLSTLQQIQQAYEILYVEQQTLLTELNLLRVESEQRIHCLERLVQWLRVHAQRHVAVAYRDSRSYKKELPKQVALLEASSLFDADWYCKQYPDVAQANIKPAEHFIKFGAIDGRHPGPLFSTEFYLTHYEDVAASGQHPLLHYLRYGIDEKREVCPPDHQMSAQQKIAKGAKA